MPPRRPTAFTIVELVVVVAIIVALLAILLPSFGRATRIAQRAACASNLRQIGTASFAYAASNRGQLIACGGRAVQIAFFNAPSGANRWRPEDIQVDWINALSTVSLVEPNKTDVGGGNLRHLPSPVWDCPSRGYRSQWELTGYNQIVIGYQYFGGIDTWQMPDGALPSRSPTALATARPDWLLGADTTMRIDMSWGGGRSTAYMGMPSHLGQGSELDRVAAAYKAGAPAGGNQLYADGSVRWMRFAQMVRFHSWGGETRKSYAAQDDYGPYTPVSNDLLD